MTTEPKAYAYVSKYSEIGTLKAGKHAKILHEVDLIDRLVYPHFLQSHATFGKEVSPKIINRKASATI
jgi:hypothetical protein